MAVLSQTGRVISLLGMSFFLVGFVHSSSLMYMVSFFCFAVLFVAFILAHRALQGVQCEREIYASTSYAGDPLDGKLHLRERQARWRMLELLDQHTNLITGHVTHRSLMLMTEGQQARTATVAGVRQPVRQEGASGRVVVIPDAMRFARRGHYRLGPLTLRGYDPFGMLHVTRKIVTEDEIIVYPHPLPVPEIVLGGRGGRQSVEVRSTGRTGETADFHGIRPYVHGDDLRRVHWKATAHTGKLAIREYEYRSSGAVQVILDLQQDIHVGHDEFSTLEASITLAASIFGHVLNAGNQAGLFTTGSHVIDLPPESGQRHLHRAMEVLALAKDDGALALPQALDSGEMSLSRRCTAIVITSTTDLNVVGPLLALRGRASQVLLVLLNPRSFYDAEEEDAAAGRPPLFALNGQSIILPALARHLKRMRDRRPLPTEEAHRALLAAATAAGIEVYPIGANIPLHQALQAIRMRM